MRVIELKYRATVALEPGEPRSLEAVAEVEEGEDAKMAARDLHMWVEEQLLLLADLAADRRLTGART